ncbi:DM9 repeat-containing protein [Cryptosporangium japonicum]|uniref:DUF3421 domain-containing protein n=1 Tax=Cryptosporangium japonicum TaxID=80872 RepID=A0ABP3DT70_9ACTN
MHAVDSSTYRWVAARHGAVPAGAPAHGREANGTPLWVCRATVDGGLYPGKVRPAFGAANIGYRGAEIKVANYEVLIDAGRWAAASGGEIPDDAEPFGHAATGERLYVVRAVLPGRGRHLGHIRPGSPAALIPYAGRNLEVTSYQVLIVSGRKPQVAVDAVRLPQTSGVTLPDFAAPPAARPATVPSSTPDA